jgi:hypothetical protein
MVSLADKGNKRIAMADLTCPGYNQNLASGTAWDFASEKTANDTQASAQQKADAKAMVAAMAQFPLHQCPHHCSSVPIIRFGNRGAPLLTTPPEADFKLALAYTDWFLDVLCIQISGASAEGSVPLHLSDIFKHEASGPPKPPQLKKDDIIDNRWVVLRVCETTQAEDIRSGITKILNISCQGFCQDTDRKCEVLSYPRNSLFRTQKWTLVPKSEGGVSIRKNPDEAFDYYQCACLAELP